eukprot:6694637-Alexandrium_andersonii.AAC.1
MSASLVGSEMCIRDSRWRRGVRMTAGLVSSSFRGAPSRTAWLTVGLEVVCPCCAALLTQRAGL